MTYTEILKIAKNAKKHSTEKLHEVFEATKKYPLENDRKLQMAIMQIGIEIGKRSVIN